MRKGYPSKLRRSVVGYASTGFAEAVKMPRAEARRASLFHQYPEAPFGEEFKFSFQISRPEVLTKLIFINFSLSDREVEVPRSSLHFLNR
jgi:hypothetical protein